MTSSSNNGRVIGLRPTTQQGVNPKDRVGATKVDLTLIPPAASVFMALGLMVGARKYGEYNWRVEPIKMRGYIAAAKRHLDQLLDGEDFDPVEMVHHGAFALSTIAIVIDAMVHGTLIDDRPIAGRGGEMVNKMSEAIASGCRENLRLVLEEIVNSQRDASNDMRRKSTDPAGEVSTYVVTEVQMPSTFDSAFPPLSAGVKTGRSRKAKAKVKRGKRNARR